MHSKAKLFMSGGSQSVRLPKEFRIEDDEVFIKRVGSKIILIPVTQMWKSFDDAIARHDPQAPILRHPQGEQKPRKQLD